MRCEWLRVVASGCECVAAVVVTSCSSGDLLCLGTRVVEREERESIRAVERRGQSRDDDSGETERRETAERILNKPEPVRSQRPRRNVISIINLNVSKRRSRVTRR